MALDTITLTATIALSTGDPASGLMLHVGAMVNVRPLLAGANAAEFPQPYPPLPARDPSLSSLPDPVPLFDDAPPALASVADGQGALLRRVVTADDGTMTITLPTPKALAYAAGARLDTDMNASRGGRYEVKYITIFPDGRMVLFPVDMTDAETVNSVLTLDISSALSGLSI